MAMPPSIRQFPLRLVLLIVGTLTVFTTHAQNVQINGPASAAAGSEISISWTGPNHNRDFISVDKVGLPERQYGPYIYAGEGSPATLKMPDTPGQYLIRYHKHDDYSVLGSSPITITAVTATFKAPTQVDASSVFSFTWEGPNQNRDFISIDPKGAADRKYGNYIYASNKKSGELRAPDEPGDYELRYHMGSSYRVIGSTPVRVGGVSVTLKAPATADAGSTIQVHWDGPGDKRDFISIDSPDLADNRYGDHYSYVEKANPLYLQMPDEPGDYLIRYHTGQTYKTLAAIPIKVGGVEASLKADAQLEAGKPFEVTWKGPNNKRDFITIVPVGTKDRLYDEYGYTARGNPLRIEAPTKTGAYELRYLTGHRYYTLATLPVEVVPTKQPGKLRIIGSKDSSGNTVDSIGAVELILDASGSMLQKLDGKRRIDLAKSALTQLTQDVLSEGTPFALRVFGHKKPDACQTDLEIPFAPLNKAQAIQRIQSIQAKNLAKTPIADSLAKVGQDLATAKGQSIIVLVTDGEETCNGDPVAEINSLKKSGFDIRINIVGFAIDELMLREDFQRWARLGNGRYFDARNGKQLAVAIRESLHIPYQVISNNEVIASGVANGSTINVPAGTHSVRLLSSPPRELGQITIKGGETSEMRISQ